MARAVCRLSTDGDSRCRPRRSNGAIARQLVLTPRTHLLKDRVVDVATMVDESLGCSAGTTPPTAWPPIETHIGAIMTKPGVTPETDDHRRVLAVLAYRLAQAQNA